MFSLFNFSSIFPGGGAADPICPYVRTPMLYVYMSLGYCFIPSPPIIRAAAEALCIRPFCSPERACIRACPAEAFADRFAVNF